MINDTLYVYAYVNDIAQRLIPYVRTVVLTVQNSIAQSSKDAQEY
jgi:hypothetical protein